MKVRRYLLALGAILLAFIGGAGWFLGPYQPKSKTINAALQGTILPRFSIHSVFYKEAVDVVLQRFHEVHPELREVPVVCQLHSAPSPGWGRTWPKVDLEMHDIPADAALRYIAMQAGMGFAVRNGAIYLYPITPDGQVPPLTRKERFCDLLDYWYHRGDYR